jgi:hypothetical protein
MIQNLKPSFIAAICALLLSLQVPLSATANEGATPVGESTLVLGRSELIKADGSVVPVLRGRLIFVGDRISTFSGGHVHVKFKDGALLSVRPNSSLLVEQYDYDPRNPEDSTVKLNLEEGVARTISGDAAKGARENFRLNTPVAAIGVRGTDFAVGASASSTRAMVNEGTIVIAPFSDTCSASGIGPCASGSLELSRDTLQLASLQSDDLTPRLVRSQSLRAPELLQRQLQLASTSPQSLADDAASDEDSGEGNPSQQLTNEVFLEVVASPTVRSDAEVAAEKVSSTDFLPFDPITVSDGQVDGFDHTPPARLTEASLSDRQLVWGHYGDSLASDRLALSFSEASATRKISVGNLNYGLFREDANPRRVATGLGVVGFRLTSAQAAFNSDTGIAVVRVNGGDLGIDFQDRSFQTTLSLGHDSLGQIDFSAAGNLYDGGFFRAIEDTQRLAGAVSYDGAEAGYFFEKQVGDGLLSGLTLWDAK